MDKVTKFNLEAAFKALDELDIPTVKGIRANRVNLSEHFTHKAATTSLIEDYYDVGSTEDLTDAQEAREAEVAKAKLARIEKIVDLNAETEEDLLPSYVGKNIIQCPQCMTLFYKNPEDIEASEENPEIVNINEVCQHCGNTSGYELIGKVDKVGADEAANFDVEDFEGDELNLDFDEPTEEAEEEAVEETTEEAPAEEEELELDLDLDFEEEPVEESIHKSEFLKKAEKDKLKSDNDSEYLTLNEDTISISKAEMAKLDKEVEDATKEVAKYKIPMKSQMTSAGTTDNVPDFEVVPEAQREAAKKAYDRYKKALAARPDRAKTIINYTDESVHKSEFLKKAEKGELKSDNDSEYLTLNEDADIEISNSAYSDEEKHLAKNLAADREIAVAKKSLNLQPAIARRFTKSQLNSLTPEELEILQHPLKNREAVQVIIDKYNPKKKKESLSEDIDSFEIYVDESGSRAQRAAAEPMVKKFMEQHPEAQINVHYFDDFKYQEPLRAGKAGKQVIVYTDSDYKVNCPELAEIPNVEIINVMELGAEQDEDIVWREIDDLFAVMNGDLQVFVGTKEECENWLAARKSPATTMPGRFKIVKCADVPVSSKDESLTEDIELTEDSGFDELMDMIENEPISEEEVEAMLDGPLFTDKEEVDFEVVEDFDEESFNEHLSRYFTEVYSNVKAFEVTSCELKENRLVVEGLIKFNSGKERKTAFSFEKSSKKILSGLNEDFAAAPAFELSVKVASKKIITEGLSYAYDIDGCAVKGQTANK